MPPLRQVAVLLLIALTSLAGYMGGWTVREGNLQNGLLMLVLCAAMSLVGAALSVQAFREQTAPARRPNQPDR